MLNIKNMVIFLDKFLIKKNKPIIIHLSFIPVVDNNNKYGDRSQQAPTANKSSDYLIIPVFDL